MAAVFMPLLRELQLRAGCKLTRAHLGANHNLIFKISGYDDFATGCFIPRLRCISIAKKRTTNDFVGFRGQKEPEWLVETIL